jgi:acyl-CoA thioester hydrolase
VPDEAHTLAGRLTPEGHSLNVRVYFEDTDFSGAVYHASYLRFLERGRSDFLRLLGVSHRALAAQNMAFAVRSMNLSFDRVARIDDLVEIRSAVAEVTGARIRLDQQVVRDGETIVSAEVTVVLVDTAGRPKRLPAAIRQAFGARIDEAS